MIVYNVYACYCILRLIELIDYNQGRIQGLARGGAQTGQVAGGWG